MKRFVIIYIGLSLILATGEISAQTLQTPQRTDEPHTPSAAYQWLEIMLEAAARDV